MQHDSKANARPQRPPPPLLLAPSSALGSTLVAYSHPMSPVVGVEGGLLAKPLQDGSDHLVNSRQQDEHDDKWCYRDEDGTAYDQPVWSYEGWDSQASSSGDDLLSSADRPDVEFEFVESPYDDYESAGSTHPTIDIEGGPHPLLSSDPSSTGSPADLFASSTHRDPFGGASRGPAPGDGRNSSWTPPSAINPHLVDGPSYTVAPTSHGYGQGVPQLTYAPASFSWPYYPFDTPHTATAPTFHHLPPGQGLLRDQVYDQPGSRYHDAAPPSAWSTGPRPSGGSLRVSTTFDAPQPLQNVQGFAIAPLNTSGYASTDFEHSPSGSVMSLYGPSTTSPFASSATTSAYASPAESTNPFNLPTPNVPVDFFLNPYLSGEAQETQEANLPPIRRKRSSSDRMAPYGLLDTLQPAPAGRRSNSLSRARRSESFSAPATHTSFGHPYKVSPTAEAGPSAASTPMQSSRSHDSTGKMLSGRYPLQSSLAPPKRAKTAWQIYLADVFNAEREAALAPLNVAQLTRDASASYKSLQGSEKQYYVQKGLEAREAYERELQAWQRTLTPEDVKRENLFRAGQRKIGKSTATNLKDPNAPAKPMSAFFLFMQAIREDLAFSSKVFKGVSDTAQQSKVAGDAWKKMSSKEKAPFDRRAQLDREAYKKAAAVYEASCKAKART